MSKNILSRLGRVSGSTSSVMQPQRMTKPSDTPTNESVPALSTNVQAHTEMYTYFTEAGATKLLMAAAKWTKVKLVLETAGPVSVSTKQVITPVLSGKGVLLSTDNELEVTVPRGDRLFIAAEGINRVKVVIEPFAWREEMFAATLAAAEAARSTSANIIRFLNAVLRKR